ncbi:hypothetical protein ZOSMA_72G00500 [Zostera marina]|uniref:Uncharacterized protein n=1 Tax=Zostera marina TaxID=29655 RepID=A0A0K9NQK4_ZOSMR|nr:hypothetical protein ZOSMA_72G00500 [Zostera marina]
MGGKGQRRREKNFLQSHGGDKRLPPPPNLKEIHAIPSKLRRLIELRDVDFKNPSSLKSRNRDTKKDQENPLQKGKHGDDGAHGKKVVVAVEDNNGVNETQGDEKKKKKRKRKTFDELHVQSLSLTSDQPITRRKRKKEYLDARKKKNKDKKLNKKDDVGQFPGHEDIKFGEVVQGPPKLSIPKRFALHNASNERLRLKAIEAYRERRRSDSRPGFHFPNGILQPPLSS